MQLPVPLLGLAVQSPPHPQPAARGKHSVLPRLRVDLPTLSPRMVLKSGSTPSCTGRRWGALCLDACGHSSPLQPSASPLVRPSSRRASPHTRKRPLCPGLPQWGLSHSSPPLWSPRWCLPCGWLSPPRMGSSTDAGQLQFAGHTHAGDLDAHSLDPACLP